MTGPTPFTFAIDAQISPAVPGGTETALLALLDALRHHPGDERYVVLGLKGHSDAMRPFIGADMTMVEYPKHYRWYVPGAADRAHARAALAEGGAVGGTVLRCGAASARPLRPRSAADAARAGPAQRDGGRSALRP
jgi:hypothetical protein